MTTPQVQAHAMLTMDVDPDDIRNLIAERSGEYHADELLHPMLCIDGKPVDLSQAQWTAYVDSDPHGIRARRRATGTLKSNRPIGQRKE